MPMPHKILVVNPGSTSTKLAVFLDEDILFQEAVRHEAAVLAEFLRVIDQYHFRRDVILKWLGSVEVNPGDLDAVVGRGGILRPIVGGTYLVNQAMLQDLEAAAFGEHAANLGARLAYEIAAPQGKPAFIVDPPVVDEMEPLARLSGLPEIPRRSMFHALNQKAVARRACRDLGKRYEEAGLVVAHLGGGITVGAHRRGRIIDVNNGLDGEGPFSPERAGTVPSLGLVHLCFSWRYSLPEVMKKLVGGGGLVAHLGTNDAREAERRAATGDEKARLVYESLAYNVAKEIGRAAAALAGRVDAVIITGGLAHSKVLSDWIRDRVSFLAPVLLYPGEDEMRALAEGCLRVLRGEESPRTYGDPESSATHPAFAHLRTMRQEPAEGGLVGAGRQEGCAFHR